VRYCSRHRRKRKKDKQKALEKNKYRIIKISKNALREFIYESVIDRQSEFFDISDVTSITSHHDIDFESGDYICLVKSIVGDTDKYIQRLSDKIDLQMLLHNMEDTTPSLYQGNRYKEVTLKEIENMQFRK